MYKDQKEPDIIEFGNKKTTKFEIEPGKLLAAENYPLEPEVELCIGKGSFSIPRRLDLGGTLKLGVTAKGQIQVFPFETNKGGNN